MHDNDSHDDGMKSFEMRLAGWQPADDGLDRDRMLFAAGEAAGRSRVQSIWIYAPSALALSALVGLAWLWLDARQSARAAWDRVAAMENAGRSRFGAAANERLVAEVDTVLRSPAIAGVSVVTLRNQWLSEGVELASAESARRSELGSVESPAILRPLQSLRDFEH